MRFSRSLFVRSLSVDAMRSPDATLPIRDDRSHWPGVDIATDKAVLTVSHTPGATSLGEYFLDSHATRNEAARSRWQWMPSMPGTLAQDVASPSSRTSARHPHINSDRGNHVQSSSDAPHVAGAGDLFVVRSPAHA